MIDRWLVIGIALVYLLLLFVVAEYAERHLKSNKPRPWIYSLSLAVYCTSWAMFGTVAQSENTGWYLAPTYLGAIFLFIFAWPILEKIIRIAKQNKITSIADFIAGRFGNSSLLGILVAMICLVAIIPYISIQLKSIVNSYFIVTGNSFTAISNEIQTSYYSKMLPVDELMNVTVWQDTAFYIALVVAAFTILFGTRRVDATEHHQGIMLAIAFESIVKLIAFLAVGIFAVYFIFDGFNDLFTQANLNSETNAILSSRQPSFIYLSQAFLGMVAILCLPRQFHVLVVENRSLSELKKSRWIFPGYLLLINLFILPIAIAGKMYFSNGGVSPEDYILMLPITENNPLLVLLVFIGGISAATSMIIVATIVLSTMVSNEIVIPLAVKFDYLRVEDDKDLGRRLLQIRRALIFIILILAYTYYREISVSEQLATTGLLSMALIAQLAPAIIAGIYWKRCTKKATIIGLIGGLVVWLYTLLLPLLISTGFFSYDILTNGPFGVGLLKPQEFLGLYGFDDITHGLLWSLSVNIFLLMFFSFREKQSLAEKIHTSHFLSNSTLRNETATSGNTSDNLTDEKQKLNRIKYSDLELLATRFLGNESTEKAFKKFCKKNKIKDISEANIVQLNLYTKNLLQAIIGSTSTRLIFESLASNRQVPFEDVFNLIDEAANVLLFNRELLQSAIENISHGVSVVDKELNLVAWNSQYVKLFDYPDELIQVGRPIADLVRFNANKGIIGKGNISELVSKRLQYMKQGSPHTFERTNNDGTVLEMRGNPMPGGGFVTSFIDITEFRKQQNQLQSINIELEDRVGKRTLELETINQQLVDSKEIAEIANNSKTRFLAAASHDVLQPLNAASLFSATLIEKLSHSEQKAIANKIQQSLHSAEDLLKDLIDISKLDSKNITPDPTKFFISDLMRELFEEFNILARENDCQLRFVECKKMVNTDRTMFRRVLQNLLSNAINHSKSNRILFGCRRKARFIQIHVIDKGLGIPVEQQEKIFDEFEQLGSDKHAIEGHGLGLAIVSRIVDILGLPLKLNSQRGKGSDFYLTIPFIELENEDLLTKTSLVEERSSFSNSSFGRDSLILCIDNDKNILDGMKSLLETWGYYNVLYSVNGDFSDQTDINFSDIALMLVDYHLDNDSTGVEIVKTFRSDANRDIPSVIITADQSSSVKKEIQNNNMFLLNKPIKPLSLKTLLNQVLKY